MIEYFRDFAVNPMLPAALVAALMASLACGVIGPYVITRRIVFLAGAIAHMAVGGLGAAIFVRTLWPDQFAWLQPIHGATAVSVASAVLIGVVHQRVGERMDTLIGAMWAVGMSVGILLVKITPGYTTELMSYLFGNLAVVGWDMTVLMAVLNAVILAVVLLFHKRLLAICIDEQQARLQGVSVMWTNILLLALVALTVICLIYVVGLILVLALLTLPAATASHHLKRLAPIMFASGLLCAMFTVLPLVLTYGVRLEVRIGEMIHRPHLPAEPVIVLAAGAVYLLSVAVTRLRRSLAR